jgi:hypothetical protein
MERTGITSLESKAVEKERPHRVLGAAFFKLFHFHLIITVNVRPVLIWWIWAELYCPHIMRSG